MKGSVICFPDKGGACFVDRRDGLLCGQGWQPALRTGATSALQTGVDSLLYGEEVVTCFADRGAACFTDRVVGLLCGHSK